MAKLTDTQLIVLSSAAARDDGIAAVPNKMNKAAASKVAASLVARRRLSRPSPMARRRTGFCEPASVRTGTTPNRLAFFKTLPPRR